MYQNYVETKVGKAFSHIILNSLFIIHCTLFIISCANETDEAAQFFLKGNVQLQKREYKEAIRYYSEAITKKPDFADAYNNRAWLNSETMIGRERWLIIHGRLMPILTLVPLIIIGRRYGWKWGMPAAV
ncbi:tetratricopeptide repeat protein [Spirosoma telluris]|uniref:tetratricopeptide repeat protein n=1 Tax=Spirosoma telluris TaxID=2183553 RepID=UPI002FC2DCDD